MSTMRCFQLFLIAAALLCIAGRSNAVTLTTLARRDVWGSPPLQRRYPNSILVFIRGGSDDQVQQEDSADEEEDEEEEEEESWGEDELPVVNEGDEEEEEEEEEANIEVQPFMEETPSSEESQTPQAEEWVSKSNNDDEKEDEEAEAVQQQQEASSYPADVVVDDPSIDDDSSAFVDRMELADAYDEGETTPGETEADTTSKSSISVPVAEADDDNEEVIVLEETKDAAKKSSPVRLNTQQAPPIDKEMMKLLVKQLNYRRREVNAMKHDIVAMVAAKRLHRPLEGIPSHWFRNDDASKPFKAARNVITRFLIPISAGTLFLWASMAQRDSGIEFTGTEHFSQPSIPSVAEPDAKVPAYDAAESTATTGATAFETQEEEDETAASPLATPKESVKHVNEHVGSLYDPHPHSVKPGQPPQDELDVTWLDKGITAVENRIKSFLRMEL